MSYRYHVVCCVSCRSCMYWKRVYWRHFRRTSWRQELRHRFTECQPLRHIHVKTLLLKFWESMVCVWSKTMFLTLPRQGTNPQIFTLIFPVRTSGPKQKVSKINWEFYNLQVNFLCVGTKHFYWIFLNWNISDLFQTQCRLFHYFIIFSYKI